MNQKAQTPRIPVFQFWHLRIKTILQADAPALFTVLGRVQTRVSLVCL